MPLAPGSNTYRDNFKLVLRRDSAHPTYLWQADNAELHMMILDETGGCLSAAPPHSHRTPRTNQCNRLSASDRAMSELCPTKPTAGNPPRGLSTAVEK